MALLIVEPWSTGEDTPAGMQGMGAGTARNEGYPELRFRDTRQGPVTRGEVAEAFRSRGQRDPGEVVCACHAAVGPPIQPQ